MNILELDALNEEVASHIGDDGYKWAVMCPNGHTTSVFIGKPTMKFQDAPCLQCKHQHGGEIEIVYSANEWRLERAAAQFWAMDYVLAWPLFWTTAFNGGWGFNLQKLPGETTPWLLNLWNKVKNGDRVIDIRGESFPEVLCRAFLEMIKHQDNTAGE